MDHRAAVIRRPGDWRRDFERGSEQIADEPRARAHGADEPRARAPATDPERARWRIGRVNSREPSHSRTAPAGGG
jgi:hypothetical protein